MKKFTCTNCNHKKVETLFPEEKKTKRWVKRLGRETLGKWCLKCIDNPVAYEIESTADMSLRVWGLCHPVTVNRNIDEDGNKIES